MGVDIEKMEKTIEELKKELGDGLVSTDIWHAADGQSIVGYNAQPKATALFNEVNRFLIKTLRESDYPGIGNFRLLQLDNNHVSMSVFAGDYQLGMLVDLTKTNLGILMGVAYPKVLKGLQEATK